MGSITPPPPPIIRQGVPALPPVGVAPSRAQQAARASWMAPLVVILFNFVLKNGGAASSMSATMVIAAVSLILYVAGFAFAIYALSRIRANGREGVLAPAIVGLLLNGCFLLIIGSVILTNFTQARARARQRQSVLQHVSPPIFHKHVA
jgi:ABC-type glycerol-3-phosphate transport system permease component